MIKKTILKEKDGRIVARVNFKIDLGFGEKDATLHEFWPSREEFQKSQHKEQASEEDVTGEKLCRSEYNLSDEEAIQLFDSLQ
ncbi:hypothetical protein [Paenibacillus polymyxa]|uniref:hypothetical protein n=1 Tax=Paenibacillus polymyxa TaxID=1406 RepID=UPI0012DB46FC|nr:hypothetical protein [Paenibacillus polymyxa]